MEKHSKILVYVGTRPLFVIVNRFFCTSTVIKNILWQLVYSRWCSQTVCSMVCIVISFMQYIGTESTSAASNYKARSLSVCMSVCPFDYLENCSSNLLHTWCILLQTQGCAVHDLVQLRHSIHWKWINNYNQSNSALYIRRGWASRLQSTQWVRCTHTDEKRDKWENYDSQQKVILKPYSRADHGQHAPSLLGRSSRKTNWSHLKGGKFKCTINGSFQSHHSDFLQVSSLPPWLKYWTAAIIW